MCLQVFTDHLLIEVGGGEGGTGRGARGGKRGRRNIEEGIEAGEDREVEKGLKR